MTDTASRVDVAIIGGGLAGLTLARQLNQASPDLAIAVFERRRLPPPPAAHKVGEATVEIGAHYLAHTLGLESLLERVQLRKFGLRMFFGSGYHGDLANADELGTSKYLPVTSYQLDRGRLERDLLDLLIERGVTVQDESVVRQVSIGGNGKGHQLQVVRDERPRDIKCRWMVDASSRTSVLKRALQLGKPASHRMCAAWFRLDGVIDVDEWSNCTSWKAQCNGLPRRLSTNHLMGPGYWAWIIPLAGNRTSVGLVTDPDLHPLSSYDTFEKFRDWSGDHQAQLAQRIADAKDRLLDFRRLKNLSQDCGDVWSGSGWALTGESGLFADPLYSSGTDFIGISNTFISDLIARRRPDGVRGLHASVYQNMYRSFFDSTMSLYERQYAGLGDTRLMVVKTTWDYAFYWSVLCLLFFRDVMTDLPFLRNVQPELAGMQSLNHRMQKAFRQRAAERRQDGGSGRFFDQSAIPVLAELNGALLESNRDPGREFSENCERLEKLGPRLLSLLAGNTASGSGDCGLLGDLASRLR